MNVGSGSERRRYPIRPAQADDYDTIIDVWRRAGLAISTTGRESRQAFDLQLSQFSGLYLVATAEDRIVGTVLGTHDQRKGWINRLAVVPQYRRRGIAAALALACDAAIRAEGIEIVAALIEPDNLSSIALFEKLGYLADVPARYFRKRSRTDI